MSEYTVKEAAQIVGISDSRVRQLVLKKIVACRRFGKSIVITEQGIEDLKKRESRQTRPKKI